MNRFLAGAVGFLNVFVALALIVLGALIGQNLGGPGSMMLGLILGFGAALIICGVLALVIDIRNTLRDILEQMRKSGAQSL